MLWTLLKRLKIAIRVYIRVVSDLYQLVVRDLWCDGITLDAGSVQV